MMKKIENSTNRKYGIILQFLQIFVSIIVSVIYTPFMLEILGQDIYGIYSVCTSSIAYLSLLALGFGSSYMRYYTRAIKKMDGITVDEVNWQYLIIFSFFGLLALILGLIFSQNAYLFFNNTFSTDDIALGSKLMFILTFNMAISFPASVFTSYISSQQKFILLKFINILKTVISPTLSFLLLLAGYGSIGIVLITTIVNTFADMVNMYFCLKKLNMRFCICRLNGKFAREVASFSIYIGINQIVNQLNFSADKIILSKVANASSVAIYSIGSTLNTYFEQVGSSIANLFDPKINKIIASDKERHVKDSEVNAIFIKVGRVQFIILALILSGFILFGNYFIKWWAGNDYLESYYITLLLMTPMIIPLLQNTAVYIQRAKFKHKFRSLLYLTTSLLNVVISILLSKKYGAAGAAFGTTITLLLSNTIINIYYHKAINLNVIKFWFEILKLTRGLVIPITIGLFLRNYMQISDFKDFMISIGVYSFTYILSMYLLVFNKSEKSIITSLLKKLLVKK